MTYISNTFNTTNDRVKYRIVVDLLEQDLILAKSKIRRRIQAWRTNTGFETFGSGSASARNDYGSAISQAITTAQKITYNSYTTLFDDQVWVDHNPDGTKQLIVGGYFTINSPVTSVDGNGNPGWNDFNVALPSIPRGSVPTATAANIEEVTTININKYNSGFTSTLRYEFPAGDVNALTGTIIDKTPLTSYGWVVPSGFYTKIPNSAVGQCKIYCDTYNGNILVETKSCLFNASVNPNTNKPNVSAVIQDTNALSVGLTGDNNKMVRYVSNANIVLSASAKNSASLVGIGVTCGDGKSSNVANSTLNAVESGAFNVSAIDSRGLVNSVAYAKDLISYVKLTMNPVLVRNTPVDSKVKLSYSGNYFNGSFGAQANTLSVKYRYREFGEANPWSQFYTLPAPIISGNTFSAENIILAPGGVQASFNYIKSWEFELLAYDKVNVNGVGNIIPVAPGEPNHDYGKGYFNHNSPIFLKNTAGVLKNIVDYFYDVGDVKITMTNVNPATRYPGTTWMYWGEGQFPVAVDPNQTEFNTPGKTGGAKTHILSETEMPVHTHAQNAHSHLATTRTTSYASGTQSSWRCMSFVGTNSDYAQNVSTGGATATNQNAGGGQAHNNLPPFKTCYIWQRTA